MQTPSPCYVIILGKHMLYLAQIFHVCYKRANLLEIFTGLVYSNHAMNVWGGMLPGTDTGTASHGMCAV